jgi:redox-sensitive bicupin YhaK (pirin superfamily)
VHFLQIWIEPAKDGLPATYEQLAFSPEEKQGKWKQLAGPVKTPGVSVINQDAKVYVSELAAREQIAHEFGAGRHGWLQVIRGGVTVNGKTLAEGDAVAISEEPSITIKAGESSEVLLFDLA